MTMLNRDCPVCGLQGGMDTSHTCGLPATGTGPHDSPFTRDCENYRRAAHALDEAHKVIADLKAENESLRADLDQALKANDMSIEDCMALKAELESLKGRIGALPRYVLRSVGIAGSSITGSMYCAEDVKGSTSDEEWIRAADLYKLLDELCPNDEKNT